MNDPKLNLNEVTVVLKTPVAVLQYLQEVSVDQIEFWSSNSSDIEAFTSKQCRAMRKGYKNVVGQLEDQLPKIRRVIVEVSGGVAEVTVCPDNIDVQIVDHDNGEELVEDEGIACCVCGCQDVDVIQVSCMEHKRPHKGRWALGVDGFAWDDGKHRDGSTTDEVAECTRCNHRGPLSDFNFPPQE